MHGKSAGAVVSMLSPLQHLLFSSKLATVDRVQDLQTRYVCVHVCVYLSRCLMLLCQNWLALTHCPAGEIKIFRTLETEDLY